MKNKKSRLVQDLYEKEKGKVYKELIKKRIEIIENQRLKGMLHQRVTIEKLQQVEIEKVKKLYIARLKNEFYVMQGKINNQMAKMIYKNVQDVIDYEMIETKLNIVNFMTKNNLPEIGKKVEELKKMEDKLCTDAKREIRIEQGKRDLQNESVETGTSLSKGKYEDFINSKFNYTKRKISYTLKKISTIKLREILKKNIEIALRCLMSDLWKPCVIICGGVIEGILYDRLLKFSKTDLNQAYKKLYPKQNVKKISEYTLENFIDIAFELKVIEKTIWNMGHGLRDYRNYIHPLKEAKQGYSISDKDANISCQFIFKLLGEL